jgi:hypothetical protein
VGLPPNSLKVNHRDEKGSQIYFREPRRRGEPKGGPQWSADLRIVALNIRTPPFFPSRARICVSCHVQPALAGPAFRYSGSDNVASRPITADFPDPGPVSILTPWSAVFSQSTSVRNSLTRPAKYQPLSPTSIPRAANSKCSAPTDCARRHARSSTTSPIKFDRCRGLGISSIVDPYVTG